MNVVKNYSYGMTDELQVNFANYSKQNFSYALYILRQ